MTATRTDAVPAAAPLAGLPRAIWPNLPMVLVGGTLVSLGAVFVAVIAPGITPVSLILAAVVVAPLFATLVAQSAGALDGKEPGALSFFRVLRVRWRLGIGIALPPAIAGCLLLVSLAVWEATRVPIAAVPLAVAAVVTVLVTLAAASALPLAVDRPELRGPSLLLLALHIVAKRPVPIIGALSLVVIAVVAAISVTASLLLLLPGPLAFVLVAAVRTSAAHSGVSDR